MMEKEEKEENLILEPKQIFSEGMTFEQCGLIHLVRINYLVIDATRSTGATSLRNFRALRSAILNFSIFLNSKRTTKLTKKYLQLTREEVLLENRDLFFSRLMDWLNELVAEFYFLVDFVPPTPVTKEI